MKADALAARARIDAKVVFILIYCLVLCELNCIGKKRCETILQIEEKRKDTRKVELLQWTSRKELIWLV